jgi:hypothetical protein
MKIAPLRAEIERACARENLDNAAGNYRPPIARYALFVVVGILVGFAVGYFVMKEVREAQFQNFNARRLTSP